jgi:hypothetical protein
VALIRLLIRAPAEGAISYWLFRAVETRSSSTVRKWAQRVQQLSGAATASRRLILLPTGQETVIPHFAPRAARTAERSVVDIAPL